MKISKILIVLIVAFNLFSNITYTQNKPDTSKSLNQEEKSIIAISALTAKGDLAKLKSELNAGLDAGLTINEIKEVLVHLYAYAGFPRSLRGVQTFMQVLDERKEKGKTDVVGKDASPISSDTSKYRRGKKILADLTNTSPDAPITGYGVFAPVVDTFLKEHLFADIFERDVLAYAQRELVTISVIAAIGSAEPMLKSHMGISLNVGITPQQLKDFTEIITIKIGAAQGRAAKSVLAEVLKDRK